MARKAFLLLFCLCLCAPFCFGQGAKVYTIDTVVGGAVYDGLAATATPLSSPNGLWLDRDGALWVADTGNQVIRKIDPVTGVMRVVVGGGTVIEDSVPVPGATVQLNRPSHIVRDAAGNIYFTDSGFNRVRKLTPDGLVTTVVGTGEQGFAGDGGLARLAKLNGPTGLAFDAAGNLFITDAGNQRIRRVDAAGAISTYAGNGQYGQSGDNGPALSASLGDPNAQGLAFDSRGNLYISAQNTIRRVDRATGVITTVVGISNAGSASDSTMIPDGTPATARVTGWLGDIVFDPDDNLYFAYGNNLAKVGAATGLVTNIGRGGTTGLVRDQSGRLIYSTPGQVRRVGAGGGAVTVIAGSNDPFDGPGQFAVLTRPLGVALDAAGVLYIGEEVGRIRRFDPSTGLVTTVLGGGSKGLADGIAATAATLVGTVQALFVDSRGNLLFTQPTTVWKIDTRTGTLSRIAGNPALDPYGPSGDGGSALEATLNYTVGILADAAGNVFISEQNGNRVRRVDAATGIITTIAGNGVNGYSGDGGPATAACLRPHDLAFDLQGNLLIAGGSGLRRVDMSTGVITTVQARSKEGDPLKPVSAKGVAVDKTGSIFLTQSPGKVSQIRAPDSVLVTLAGSTEGFFGDGGLASLARLGFVDPSLAVDGAGNIFVADQNNGRVRKLTPTVILPVVAISPGTLFFTQVQGSTTIGAQVLNITSANSLPFNWTLDISTSTGGSWLNASSRSGSVAGGGTSSVMLMVASTRLGAGTYRGTVTITATGATNSPQTVEVVLTVTGAAGAAIGLSQQYLNFQGVQGGANPAPQTLSISNVGSGTLSWSATADTSSGGQWLRISSGLGTAPSTLTISADITGLAQGVYQGQVTLRNLTASEMKIISVVLTVSKTQPILLPTQTGFLFVGIEGSLVIGPQSFAIQNAGQGRMDWQVQVNLPAGGDWLRVSPTSGTSDAAVSVAPTVTLLVDPSKLRAGVSVGLLTITASGALNAPQTGIVLVNMLARGSLPVGTINPLGVIFTAASGASGALTQGISIASTGGQALQFLARTQTQAGGSWLSVTPEQGVLLSSAESASLQVQASAAGLATGVYFGTVTLSFGTGVTQEVAVALVVSPVATSQTAGPQLETWNLEPGTSAAACAPRRLVIVETKLGNRFSLQSGWPIPMLVQAADDCGMTVTNATVVASFTSGDPPAVFQNLRNGNYAATWVPATKGSIGVTVRAVASGLDDGVFQFSGTLGEASKLPLVFRDGWVNAASFDRYKPLAPGMIFSLFGSNLAEGKNLAAQIPLPRSLGNIKATLGGYEVPLFYADSGQVNAQVPFELTPGVATLVVTGKDAAGAPGSVTIVSAQPGVFTVSQSGTGQGVVLDGLNNLVDSSHAVKAGEVVVIYATGLGATNPPVATGQSAPAVPPLALVTTPVKVTIGGVEAAVEFAGLAPGFVGLYQVNARVPAGAPTGNAVPLVLTQNGVASNTVTIAVK
jgi:uncharacterized protein (TIGR03437 family)